MSSTRGYTPQSSGGTKKVVPYAKEHLNEKCPDCHNMDNGRPVKGHKQGSPLCPLVQQKKRPPHPRFKKVGWEPSGSVVANSSKSSNPKRGLDGKFVPRGKGKGKSGSSHPVMTVLAKGSEDSAEEV